MRRIVFDGFVLRCFLKSTVRLNKEKDSTKDMFSPFSFRFRPAYLDGAIFLALKQSGPTLLLLTQSPCVAHWINIKIPFSNISLF